MKYYNGEIEIVWKELCDTNTSPDIDPTDIFDNEMESLRNQEYSMKLMNICCLSETWEQDLYNFLKEKVFLFSSVFQCGTYHSGESQLPKNTSSPCFLCTELFPRFSN